MFIAAFAKAPVSRKDAKGTAKSAKKQEAL
jgi:hypothetical protein